MVKQKNSKQPKAASVRKAQKNKNTRKVVEAKTRTDSKQAEVISMLNRPQGVTIPTIVEKTGWQQHSVRGFFAGIVRKKLGLALQSEKKEGTARIYRIVGSTTASDNSAKRERARKVTNSSQQSSGSRVL